MILLKRTTPYQFRDSYIYRPNTKVQSSPSDHNAWFWHAFNNYSNHYYFRGKWTQMDLSNLLYIIIDKLCLQSM